MNNSTIVFSVFQSMMPERGNLFNHAQAARDLDEAGLTYEVSEVSFKGVLELGFTVQIESVQDYGKLLRTLYKYEQDIVLWTNDKGQGSLANPYTMKEIEL